MRIKLLLRWISFPTMKMSIYFLMITVILLVGCEKRSFEMSEGIKGGDAMTYNVALPGYTLVWEDNFDGSILDSTKWKYRTDCKLQSCQRPENVVVDDTLKILLKEENYQNKPYTGGGIITRQPSGHGYYEVSAKLDGGYGWHEAFWTTGSSGFDDPNPLTDEGGRKLEIDCFEHYGDYDALNFTYGAIEWGPFQGGINRDYVTITQNLAADYHTYGFEYTPDYLNYYFEGELLKTVDMRSVPQHDFYLWLTCIATEPDATESGTVYFDYIRAYEISPEDYELRKVQFINDLDSLRGPQESNGTDLWVEAEDFVHTNNWTIERDIDQAMVLKGFAGYDAERDSTDLKATTGVVVDEPGVYKLWVRSRDFDTQQGHRKFKLIINGEESPVEFGTHGEVGYEWQSGGDFALEEGVNILELYDSSQYFARCDKILLTTDISFEPEGIGGFANTSHVNP
ncbi:glycoside hydrolase family 16 protein [Sinomicrobium sp. M5D2P17]